MKTSYLGYVSTTEVIEMLEDLRSEISKDKEKYNLSVDTLRDSIDKIKEELTTKNVSSMALIKDDATLWSPIDALVDAMNGIGSNSETSAFTKDTKKILIIALNTFDDNYSVSYIQAGMRTSELLGLCDVAKTIFLRLLGHIE